MRRIIAFVVAVLFALSCSVFAAEVTSKPTATPAKKADTTKKVKKAKKAKKAPKKSEVKSTTTSTSKK
jgi:hypothetical protein